MKGVGIHMSLQRPAPKFGSPEVSHIGVDPLIRTKDPALLCIPAHFLFLKRIQVLSQSLPQSWSEATLFLSEPWSEGDKAPLSQLFLRKQLKTLSTVLLNADCSTT